MSCFDTFETRRPGAICSLIQLLWGISHVPGTVKWVPRRFPYLWVGVLGPVFRKDKEVLCQRHGQRQWTKRRKRSYLAGGIKECFLEEGKIDHGLKSWHGFDHQSIIHNFCLSVKISLK